MDKAGQSRERLARLGKVLQGGQGRAKYGVVDAYPSTDADGQPGVVCDRSKAMVAHNGGLGPTLEAVLAKMRAIEAVLTFAAFRTFSMVYVKSISNIG